MRTAAHDTELGGHPVPRRAFVAALSSVTHLDPEPAGPAGAATAGRGNPRSQPRRPRRATPTHPAPGAATRYTTRRDRTRRLAASRLNRDVRHARRTGRRAVLPPRRSGTGPVRGGGVRSQGRVPRTPPKEAALGTESAKQRGYDASSSDVYSPMA
ncbi:hypothetical protein GCM10022245_45130 [Streptomyces mayteni]